MSKKSIFEKYWYISCLSLTYILLLSVVFWYVKYGSYLSVVASIRGGKSIEAMTNEIGNGVDYVKLLDWVDEELDFVQGNETFNRFTDGFKPMFLGWRIPLKILNEGRGKCEEHSILYIAACFSQGYEARLIVSYPPGDHAWAEVKINGTWVHVDPSDKVVDDPYMYWRSGKSLVNVFAFELGLYENVTERYIPQLSEK